MTGIMAVSRKVWRILARDEQRELAVLFTFMLAAMGLETMSAGLVVPVLSLLVGGKASEFAWVRAMNGALGNPAPQAVVMLGLVLLASGYLLKNLFLAMLAWRQTRFAHQLEVQLAQRLFALYLAQPYTFHLQRNSAVVINSITNEVNMTTAGVIGPALVLTAELLVLAALGGLLLFVEPESALVVGIVVGASFVVFHRLTRRRVDQWGETRQYHQDQSMQHLQQGVAAAKEIALLGRESEFLARFLRHNSRRAGAARRHEALQQMPRLALEVIAIGCLAGLAIAMLASGRPAPSVIPLLGLFAAVAFRVMPSVNRILGSVQIIRYCMPAIDRVHDDLTLLPHGTLRVTGGARWSFQETVELVNVSYQYDGASAPALNGLSLRIHRGESVGIVGPSGAGKSTLIDVLLGLLEPATGRVLVDGQDLRHNPRRWQDQVGYVPQMIYLTDDSVRRNIAFGVPDELIDDTAVWRSLQLAQLAGFVEAMPDGLNSVVGERGVRISGGERQRLGIARALYHDPAVLVLDEATSSLDGETENGVIGVLRQLHGARTIVIVTHRTTTTEHCDRVYRLVSGQIRDEFSARDANGAVESSPRTR